MPEQSIVITMNPTAFAAGVVGVMAMCGLVLGFLLGSVRGSLNAIVGVRKRH